MHLGRCRSALYASHGYPHNSRVLRLEAALVAVLLVCAAFAPEQVQAQQPAPATAKKRSVSSRPAKAAPKRASGRRKAGSAKAERKPVPAAATPTPSIEKPGTVSAGASGEVRTEGGTQVKVMEFRGLDIEGQLKTPQMLYFLNRMRAEFGRPRLPHRSFMPELSRSSEERVF